MIDAIDIALMCDKEISDELEESLNMIDSSDYSDFDNITNDNYMSEYDYSNIDVNGSEDDEVDIDYMDDEVEELIDDMVDELCDTDGSVMDAVVMTDTDD